MRRRRSEDVPYDPKNPPVISNISPMINMSLRAYGFDDRVIEEITSFISCHWMSEASCQYSEYDCKSSGGGYSIRHVIKEESFSAYFGPSSSHTIVSNDGRGSTEVKLDTPLAQELLDIQKKGMDIVYKGKRREKESRYSYKKDPDVDCKNYSHLFRMYKHYSCETSSKDETNISLKCCIIRRYVVLCKQCTSSYAGKWGDYDEELELEIYACPWTDDLIQAFNKGLAKWMESIAGPPVSLPSGLLSGLERYIQSNYTGKEDWDGFEKIFEAVKKYSYDDDDESY